MSFALKIFILLLFISGVIAFLGDYLGRLIGKNRLSLFNLRPQHTAVAVTIITGILIALTTVGIILLVSANARTAIFGMEELKRSITAAERELKQRNRELAEKLIESRKLEEKLTAAKSSAKKLGKEIEVARKGQMLFKVGDTLFISLVKAGEAREKVDSSLQSILTNADAYLRGMGLTYQQQLIFVSEAEFNRVSSLLENSTGDYAVILKVNRNTLFGEEIPASFETKENKLIYPKGKEIALRLVAARLQQPEIEQEIKRLLFQVHQLSRAEGVIPDPTGSLGSVPYAQIFNLAKKIKSYDKGVSLSAVAKEDVFAVGPLELDFKIYYQ